MGTNAVRVPGHKQDGGCGCMMYIQTCPKIVAAAE